MKRVLDIGDVFRSPLLAFGRRDRSGAVVVDGITKLAPVTHFRSEDERVKLAAETGKIPPKTYVVDEAAYDPTRGEALFIVTRTSLSGGGTGMGPHDVYPDGHHVMAFRLDADGEYKPDGEQVKFYQTGCFNCMVYPKDIEFVERRAAAFPKKETRV